MVGGGEDPNIPLANQANLGLPNKEATYWFLCWLQLPMMRG